MSEGAVRAGEEVVVLGESEQLEGAADIGGPSLGAALVLVSTATEGRSRVRCEREAG